MYGQFGQRKTLDNAKLQDYDLNLLTELSTKKENSDDFMFICAGEQ